MRQSFSISTFSPTSSSSNFTFTVDDCRGAPFKLPSLRPCLRISHFSIEISRSHFKPLTPSIVKKSRLNPLFVTESSDENQEANDDDADSNPNERQDQGEAVEDKSRESKGQASIAEEVLNQGGLGDSDTGRKNRLWDWTNIWNKRTGTPNTDNNGDGEREENPTMGETEDVELDSRGNMELPRKEDQGKFWNIFRGGFRRTDGELQPASKSANEINFPWDDEGLEIQWRDIVDPTPENLLALVLTGLLGLAVLQIFWQLLLVAAAITLAALKYSVIAAILIALLVVFL